MVTEQIAPASVEELGLWLKELDPGRRVVVRGLGSNLSGDHEGLTVVDTTSLAGIGHRVDDFSVTVGAGVTWATLQDQLALVGQRVAVDPPGVGTVGAMVATGARGGLIHRYGGIRDQIIGMTVVLADGSVAHSGSTVIKNVAGYDLAKLFAGSRGRFGIIAEVIFRTRPLPETQRTLLVTTRPDRLRDVIIALMGAHVELSALDLVDDTLSGLIEGGHEVIDQRIERLERAVSGSSTMILGEAESVAHWSRLRGFQLPGEGGMVFALSARSTAMLDLLPTIRATLGPALVALVAHVGAGVAEISVQPEHQEHRLANLQGVLGAGAVEARAWHPHGILAHETWSRTLATAVRHVTDDSEVGTAATISAQLLIDRIAMAFDPYGRFYRS
ncbi:FAD-binding oxidoreductase [Ferrimicrobium sp.]|uniref:FAD-binding oxidoreductase n=1 Tax=Ferrimicrobium sp. TaxID=2926050 RepID=UPI002639CCC9|nr:FAD-binding oxidoreductase [Ferrimicrobium sp.]